MNAYWLLFAATLCLSLGLTPLFRKIALHTHFLDSPAGQLKRHTAPVPYMGGLAIYFAFLMGSLGVIILDQPSPEEAAKLLALLAGGTVVMLLGLADDLFFLSPAVKFSVQIAAALLLIAFGVKLEFIPSLPWLGTLLTVFWVVSVTNAVNLIDIMDGLAGGVCLIACLGFVLVPLMGEQGYVNLAAAALGGSLLGFLPYNYQPARIYMGDSGALFLGFILAGLAMGQQYTQVNSVGLYAPILILGIPLYDTALVTVLRLLKGRPVFQGSNDHLALRLRALGMSVKPIVHALWALSGLLALAAGLLVRVSEKRALALTLALFAATLVATLLVSQIPVDEGKKPKAAGLLGLFHKPKRKR